MEESKAMDEARVLASKGQRYIIVDGNLNILTLKVNQLITMGYTTLGGISKYADEYAQAMVKSGGGARTGGGRHTRRK
jgi:hypothetical protein